MSDVYYIKLLSGEEIISIITPNDDPQILVLCDPLRIDNNQDEDGNHVVFLTRLVPYMATQSINLPASRVLLMERVSEMINRYYVKSVEFCRAYIDQRFTAGIGSAVNYIDEALKHVASGEFNVQELAEEGAEPQADPLPKSTLH
jgi:hypothetical protein